jgi:hypothetical protein
MQYFIAMVLVNNGHAQYKYYLDDTLDMSILTKKDVIDFQQRAQRLIEQYDCARHNIDFQELIDSQLNRVMAHFIASELTEMGYKQYHSFIDKSVVPAYFDQEDVQEKQARAKTLIQEYTQHQS